MNHPFVWQAHAMRPYNLCQGNTVYWVPARQYDWVPANTDEHFAAQNVINYFPFCDFYGDKGFLGWKWQTQILDQTNNLVWTPRRANQRYQNSQALDRWLNSVRERIEGVFHEVQNTGRNLERLLAKTVEGLCTRVISKMTSHLLRHLLLFYFDVNVQTFETVES